MWKEWMSAVWPELKGLDRRSKWMAGMRETEVWLDGWCKGGLGQHRNDGGGCATMRERSERVESRGTYGTEWVSRGQILLFAVFFRTPLPHTGGYRLERGKKQLHDAVGIIDGRRQIIDGGGGNSWYIITIWVRRSKYLITGIQFSTISYYEASTSLQEFISLPSRTMKQVPHYRNAFLYHLVLWRKYLITGMHFSTISYYDASTSLQELWTSSIQ